MEGIARQTFDLDHVVILVEDLPDGITDYTNLGFNVTPGGEHASGLTHNALIPFEDGSYLELIAFKSPGLVADSDSLQHVPELWRRFEHRRALGQGLVDFALACASLEPEILRLKRQGLGFTGPSEGGRSRPDGQELRWLTAIPGSFDLPFLIEDLTPRNLRVPGGAHTKHPNGAVGIAKVTVITGDLRSSISRYDLLFGAASQEELESGETARSSASYRAGHASISLVGSMPGDLTARRATEADRPYGIELLGIGTSDIVLSGPAAHGAKIEIHTQN
jgi:hypothetical protein